jgi:hypothetical protein
MLRILAEDVMDKKKQDKKWGHCSHCKHFDSPAKAPLDGEEAACLQPELAKFSLRVFGTCGCNGFELRAGLSKSIEEPALRA